MIIFILTSCSANPNHIDEGGISFLMYAADAKKSGIHYDNVVSDDDCKLLLKHGANINETGKIRYTALDYTVCYNEKKPITKLLVESGAKIRPASLKAASESYEHGTCYKWSIKKIVESLMNIIAYLEKISGSSSSQSINSGSTNVPIIVYHHISENIEDTETTITPENFRSQMQVLKEKGYNTVFCKDLIEYVYHGRELPKNPIMITFDDGYTSVYQYAYPILKELGMIATVNIIGISVGKDKYKETNLTIIPHFDYTTAREMYLSGVMDFQSHSYDMHTPKSLDKYGRHNALKKKEESERDYISFFKKDYIKCKDEMEKNIGNQVYAYFYPSGEYSELSEVILRELGNKISGSIEPGVAIVIKGFPRSLYALKRINIANSLSGKELIHKIESYTKLTNSKG